MKKICIMLGSMNGLGGTGRAVSILANHLCKEYDVKILCYDQDVHKIGYDVEPSIPIDSIFDHPKRMTYGIFKMIPYMTHYLRKNHIQTVLVCGALNFIGGIIAARLAGVRVICCDHSNYTSVMDAKFERQSRNFAARFSDYLVTLTEKDIQNYRDGTKVNAKMLAIPNITDDALLRKTVSYNESSRKILSVGRLTYAKNYELLIDIAKGILDENPEWSWDIYGEGELREELEAKIKNTKVQRLTLMGNVSDMYDRYKDYAFLVMTSRYEGFPMVLIEAMANKLPCIAFDCQTGPSDIILDGTDGTLVEPSDIDGMKKAIRAMIADEKKRLEQSNNTHLTLEKFETANLLEKWKQII